MKRRASMKSRLSTGLVAVVLIVIVVVAALYIASQFRQDAAPRPRMGPPSARGGGEGREGRRGSAGRGEADGGRRGARRGRGGRSGEAAPGGALGAASEDEPAAAPERVAE
jgi:hypothetical protein